MYVGRMEPEFSCTFTGTSKAISDTLRQKKAQPSVTIEEVTIESTHWKKVRVDLNWGWRSFTSILVFIQLKYNISRPDLRCAFRARRPQIILIRHTMSNINHQRRQTKSSDPPNENLSLLQCRAATCRLHQRESVFSPVWSPLMCWSCSQFPVEIISKTAFSDGNGGVSGAAAECSAVV